MLPVLHCVGPNHHQPCSSKLESYQLMGGVEAEPPMKFNCFQLKQKNERLCALWQENSVIQSPG